MTNIQIKKHFVVLGAGVLLLGACAPNFFPDGYTYHNKPYKSQDASPSQKFTTEMRATMGPAQADQFRLAVYSLVERLTARAGMPPKPAYVVMPEKMSPLYANIDNNLRESLRHMGYRLSDTPDGSYAFTYAASVMKDAEGKALPDDGVTPNVRLTLYVFDKMGEGAKMLTQEAGDFYIHGAEKLNFTSDGFPGLSAPDDYNRTGLDSE